MPTRAQLDRLIASDEAMVLKLRAHADRLEAGVVAMKQMREAGTNEVLHKRLRSSIVSEPSMEKSHRLRISEGHKGDTDPFLKAIRARGYSQNSLAKAVGVNQAVLSLHRKKVRKIPLSRAKDIEKRTGWPADAKHWPVGIVSDGE